TELDTGVQLHFDLPGIATDLDVSDDGSFAIMTLPGSSGSTVLELALPATAGSPLEATAIDGEYVGLARLAPAGDTMVLYTTVNPFGGMMDAPGGLAGGAIVMATDGDTDTTSTGTSTGETTSGSDGTTGSGTSTTGTE